MPQCPPRHFPRGPCFALPGCDACFANQLRQHGSQKGADFRQSFHGIIRQFGAGKRNIKPIQIPPFGYAHMIQYPVDCVTNFAHDWRCAPLFRDSFNQGHQIGTGECQELQAVVNFGLGQRPAIIFKESVSNVVRLGLNSLNALGDVDIHIRVIHRVTAFVCRQPMFVSCDACAGVGNGLCTRAAGAEASL